MLQTYQRFATEFDAGLKRYRDTDAYAAYALYPDRREATLVKWFTFLVEDLMCAALCLQAAL